MNKADLKSLEPVLELSFQQSQRRLAELNEKMAQLRGQLTDLDKARIQPKSGEDLTDNPAFKVGADITWQRWADQRRKDINMELARLASQRPDFIQKLRKDFGKKEALGQMMTQVREQERILQRRREP